MTVFLVLFERLKTPEVNVTKAHEPVHLWSMSIFIKQKPSFSRGVGVFPWCSWCRGHARSASSFWAVTPGSWWPGGCCTPAHLLSSWRVRRPRPDRAPVTQESGISTGAVFLLTAVTAMLLLNVVLCQTGESTSLTLTNTRDLNLFQWCQMNQADVVTTKLTGKIKSYIPADVLLKLPSSSGIWWWIWPLLL